MTFARPLDVIEDVDFVITLASDLETVVKITAIHDGNTAHFGKTKLLTKEVLDRAIGKNITKVFFVDPVIEDKGDDDIDGVSKVTKTTDELNKSIKEQYELFLVDFKGGK